MCACCPLAFGDVEGRHEIALLYISRVTVWQPEACARSERTPGRATQRTASALTRLGLGQRIPLRRYVYTRLEARDLQGDLPAHYKQCLARGG